MSRRLVIWVICLAALGNGLTGCVYYNTFYNAKKEFNQAEKYRKQSGVGTQSGYKNAIDKALKVIENHPNSKYYDDALFVLAVSYYHTQQYPRAERRFRELLANYPDSKFAKQSMVYLAQSKLQIDDHDEAIELFEEIFAEDFDKEYKADAAMELGLYHIEEKDFARARSYFLAVRDSLGDDAQKQKAQRHIADTYFDAFDFDDALSAYLQILGMKPDKGLKYHALHNSAICSYRLQRIDAGLDYLEELAKDQLYYDSLGAIQLTMAMGYEYSGDLPQAEVTYADVASKSVNQSWVTEANYQLGLIYQFDYDDLPKAKEYYDKAIRANPNTESGKDAVQRSADIAKLQMIASRQKAIRESEARQQAQASRRVGDAGDTLGVRPAASGDHGTQDSLAIFDTTASDSLNLRDTVAVMDTTLADSVVSDSVAADTLFSDVPTAAAAAAAAPAEAVSADSALTLLNADTTRVDSVQVDPTLADTTLADSLRVDSTLVNAAPGDSVMVDSMVADSAGQLVQADSVMQDSTRPDSLAAGGPAALSPKKADSVVVNVDSIMQERKRLADLEADADIIFQLAELYWFQLNKPDSAIEELKGLIRDYPNTVYAPRAMLALGTMYREYLTDTLGADSILQEAYRLYSKTDYAPEILRALNITGTEADTGYPEYYYRLAENFLIDSNNVDSAQYYYQYVVDNFPESKLALQARFNTVWLMENYRSPGDSSVIYAYQEIIETYPGTPQAQEAEKRLAYKAPQKKKYVVEESEKPTLTAEDIAPGGVIMAKPVDTERGEDSIGRYVDPKERIYVGPKGEQLILLDINPQETRIEFEFPSEAGSVEGLQFEVYFQILLDFSGKVVDYVLKSPAPHDEINRRLEKTVGSMSFDPLEVNRELTRKSEVVTLPEEQEDERGRWYVYKVIVEKPDYLK